MTIPRLELAAALLLAQPIEKVRGCCRSKPAQVYCWTDSQITYHRIQNISSRFATFVAVRVAEIQQLTQQTDWRFIPGELNPADLVSRGMPAAALRSSGMWWNGPEFLVNKNISWPEELSNKILVEDAELKQIVAMEVEQSETDVVNIVVKLVAEKSTLKSVINIIVYLVRIYINMHKWNSPNYFVRGPICLQEREDAMVRAARGLQQFYFEDDYQRLLDKKPLLRSSHILALNPFMDPDNLLRVGGRLAHTASQRQILLPICKFSRLLLEDLHRKNLHAGPQSLLAFSRQLYWIIGGLSICKTIVHKCILCFKRRPILLAQIMADLHSALVLGKR